LILLIVLGSGLALGSSGSGADDEIHKCEDENGIVVYQDTPCPERPPEKPVAPSVTPPPRPEPQPAATEQPADIPAKQAPPPAPPRPPQKRRPIERTVDPRPPKPHDDASGPADARFASPERTWRSFLTAIQSGDRAAAAACFTPEALTKLGPPSRSFPLEELRETVSTFTGVEIEGDLGPFWSIRGLRRDQRPKWIFLEKTARGEWRIAGI
jgi:hypothetical protein